MDLTWNKSDDWDEENKAMVGSALDGRVNFGVWFCDNPECNELHIAELHPHGHLFFIESHGALDAKAVDQGKEVVAKVWSDILRGNEIGGDDTRRLN